jgi:cell division protein FtsB
MTRARPMSAPDRPRIGSPAQDAIPNPLRGAIAPHDFVRMVRPALIALILVPFLGYVLLGSNSILKGIDYRRLKAERTAELAMLDAERIRLAHRSDLLDPRGADVDLADEMIRSELGYVRPDEVIIELPD